MHCTRSVSRNNVESRSDRFIGTVHGSISFSARAATSSASSRRNFQCGFLRSRGIRSCRSLQQCAASTAQSRHPTSGQLTQQESRLLLRKDEHLIDLRGRQIAIDQDQVNGGRRAQRRLHRVARTSHDGASPDALSNDSISETRRGSRETISASLSGVSGIEDAPITGCIGRNQPGLNAHSANSQPQSTKSTCGLIGMIPRS